MRMSWSWRVGRLFGIDLRVHATFAILLVVVAISHIVAGRGPMAALADVAFVLLVFGIVVLHELGHALVARRYGCPTKDITLLPIGGVARLERMPTKPLQELAVAIAGPSVNVAIACACAIVAIATGSSLGDVDVIGGPFLAKLFWVNVTLAAFNMLPAFPMDGGRVLRALLSLKLERHRATKIAAVVGRGFAVVLGIVGLFVNPLLMIIAVFVWLGASQEQASAALVMQRRFERARDAMNTDVHPLAPQTTIAAAAEALLRTAYQALPVAVDGQVIGVITRSRVLEGLKRTPNDAVLTIVEPVAHVDPDARLDGVAEQIAHGEVRAAVVEEGGRLRGLVTQDGIVALAAMRRAMAH